MSTPAKGERLAAQRSRDLADANIHDATPAASGVVQSGGAEMGINSVAMETHMMELECLGVTAVRGAIAPPLLQRLRAAHDRVCGTIRRNAPPEEWSYESDEPGVVVHHFPTSSLFPLISLSFLAHFFLIFLVSSGFRQGI